VALYDREKDLATVVFYADKGVEKNVSITFRGSDSEVLREGKSALILDRVENRSLMVLGEEETEITRSAISAPLYYEGEVVGAIQPRATNRMPTGTRTWSCSRESLTSPR